MTIKIRIPQSLLVKVRKDLERPHSIAFERIGFLFGGSVKANNHWIVTIRSYAPVAETDYIPDEEVGAKINSKAIREALQNSMDLDESAFHVHQHSGRGIPYFSSVDLKSLKQLVPSFLVATPNRIHGGIVLNEKRASAIGWIPGNHYPQNTQISIIGFPSQILPMPLGGLNA